jgi:hypothetical protein
MKSFSGTIYKEGMNYLIELPAKIIKELKISGFFPVRGFADTFPFKGTCVPRKENRYALFLNGEIRNAIRKTEHDAVLIRIEYDPESRDLPVPEDLEMVLSEEKGLYPKFLALTPAHRRELIRYVLAAKKPETRLKYIGKVINHTRNYKKK